MLPGPRTRVKGGYHLKIRALRPRKRGARSAPRTGLRHPWCRNDLGYERVTAYCPQAVNVTTTWIVWPPRVTAAVSVPESNRGNAVQLAL